MIHEASDGVVDHASLGFLSIRTVQRNIGPLSRGITDTDTDTVMYTDTDTLTDTDTDTDTDTHTDTDTDTYTYTFTYTDTDTDTDADMHIHAEEITSGNQTDIHPDVRPPALADPIMIDLMDSSPL